jgi:hypothetical protein
VTANVVYTIMCLAINQFLAFACHSDGREGSLSLSFPSFEAALYYFCILRFDFEGVGG